MGFWFHVKSRVVKESATTRDSKDRTYRSGGWRDHAGVAQFSRALAWVGARDCHLPCFNQSFYTYRIYCSNKIFSLEKQICLFLKRLKIEILNC